MFRKYISKFIFIGVVSAIASIPALAQSAPASGTVELLNSDGTSLPVAVTLVEFFSVVM